MKKLLFAVIVAAMVFVSCTETNQPIAEEITYNSELTQAEKDHGRLTAEIMWKMGRVSQSTLSPDGSKILFAISRYNLEANKGNSSLYMMNTEGGEPVQLTDTKGTEWNPQWIANGDKIAFLSTRGGSAQIWEMNADGSNMSQVSNIESGVNGFSYSPNGKHVYYYTDVKLEETTADKYPELPQANVRIYDDLMYRHWNDWTDHKFSHIFVSEITDGKITEGKDIMEGEKWDSPMDPYFDGAEIAWSSTGKYIAYSCKKLYGREYAVSTNSDIYLYSLESGETKNLSEGMMGYDRYPSFSPDDKMLAWQSMETDGYESDKMRLFVLNMETGEKSYLNEKWDQNASHYIWNEDGTEIYFTSGIHATYQLYKVNVATKEFTQLTEGQHNYNSFDKVDDKIIVEKSTHQMATEIFRINPENGEETQLTFTNKHIYDHIDMGKTEERWVKTTDGKEMLVWVIYPPNFDENKKYPALLYTQGGPQSAVSQFFSFRWNFSIMAAHDYIIVAPNRRGLPSFGEEWNRQISGDYSGQNIKDYLSAIDDVKKESYVDENRLGAVGASYGGYSVYYLAGHHDKRFKAFISHCGMFNLESFYAATEETFFPNFDLGGPYWDKNNKVAQRSYANSPHKFVQNWDTPILIIAGEYDFRIPYTESLQAFNAAQLQGVPSKLIIFPDETHFVTKPQNAVVWQTEFFNWLDTYLK